MHKLIPCKTELDLEYADLEEEYWQSDTNAERRRCASRMNEIITEEACQVHPLDNGGPTSTSR